MRALALLLVAPALVLADEFECATWPAAAPTAVRHDCDAGYGWNDTITYLCVECPAGTYGLAAPSSGACIPCPNGQSTPDTGMSGCFKTQAGYQYATKTSATPTICPAGTSSIAGGPCQPCQDGTWQATPGGANGCSGKCPVMHILPATFESATTYDAASDRSADCEKCPAGTSPAVWTAAGSSYPSTEGAGGQTCMDCNHLAPYGWRADGDDRAWMCNHCPVGTVMPAQAGYDMTSDASGNCTTDCSAVPNAAAGSEISALFNQCIDPIASLDSAGVGTCEMGHVMNTTTAECDQCPENTWALPGWEACMPCAGETTSEAGSGGCVVANASATPTCDAGTHLVPAPADYDAVVGTIFRNLVVNGCASLWAALAGSGPVDVVAKPFMANAFERLCPVTCAANDVTTDTPDVAWGMDDDKELYQFLFVLGMPAGASACPAEYEPCGNNWVEAGTHVSSITGREYTWPSQPGGQGWVIARLLAAAATGLVTKAATDASGEGIAHILYEYNNIRGHTPCTRHVAVAEGVTVDGHANRECVMEADADVPQLPWNCAAAKGLCTSPIIAIFCPQTCGIVPSPQTQMGAPFAHYSGDDPQSYFANPFWSAPIRPPSMASCPAVRRSGKWNHDTRMLEPYCAPCVTDTPCAHDSTCRGGTCVIRGSRSSRRKLLFGSLPGKCTCCVPDQACATSATCEGGTCVHGPSSRKLLFATTPGKCNCD